MNAVEVFGRTWPAGYVCTVIFTTSTHHPEHVLMIVMQGAETWPWWIGRDVLVRGLDSPVRSVTGGGVVSVFPPITRRHRRMEIVLDNEIDDAVAVEVHRDSLAAAVHTTHAATAGTTVRR